MRKGVVQLSTMVELSVSSRFATTTFSEVTYQDHIYDIYDNMFIYVYNNKVQGIGRGSEGSGGWH